MLNRVGYSPEISHGVLVEMAEHRKELEKKTKPILDTLRSYQDLPPVSLTIVFMPSAGKIVNYQFLIVFCAGQGIGCFGNRGQEEAIRCR